MCASVCVCLCECVSHSYQTRVRFADTSADVSDTEPAGRLRRLPPPPHHSPPLPSLTWNSLPVCSVGVMRRADQTDGGVSEAQSGVKLTAVLNYSTGSDNSANGQSVFWVFFFFLQHTNDDVTTIVFYTDVIFFFKPNSVLSSPYISHFLHVSHLFVSTEIDSLKIKKKPIPMVKSFLFLSFTHT